MSKPVRRQGSAVYYARRTIPKDLREAYGRREFWKTLETTDCGTAKLHERRQQLAWDEEFAARRRELEAAAQSTEPGAKGRAMTIAQREAWQRQRDEWEREQWEYQCANPAPEYDDLSPEEQRTQDAVEAARERWEQNQREERELLREERLAEAVAKRPSVAPAKVRGTALDAIVDKWAAERKVSAKGVDTHRAVARWFVKRVGELPVEKITKRDVLTFKAGMVAEGTTTANVKVKIARLKTLLNYAVANDYISVNPAKDVIVIIPEGEKAKRKPFDLPSLTAIFSSPIYSQDERPTQGRGEAAYWLPLLALYTGARLEEMGQLRPSDVREETYPDADDNEQKAWFIHVMKDEKDDLKLKNAGSERVIPVYPVLEELGFIRFVQAARDAGQSRLFPALRPDKYGRLTAKWGEWFGAYKKKVVGITDKRLVFHSFRHTFKDKGRGRMSDGVQRQIMGHSSSDVADNYGSGFELWQLVEGMRQYKVPGFKLPPPPPAYRAAPGA